MKHALSTLTLIAAAALLTFGCKPADVEVSDGEACHLGNGWKQCGSTSVCLDDRDREMMVPSEWNQGEATITTETGSTADSDAYDCWGLLRDKCVRKGVCHQKAALGQHCGGSDMCQEGTCIGTVEDDGLMHWRCRPDSEGPPAPTSTEEPEPVANPPE